MKPRWLLILFWGLYFFFAARCLSGHRFLNDDLEILERAKRVYSEPGLLFAADHSGRNHILMYLFMGALWPVFHLHPFPYYLMILALHSFAVYGLMRFFTRCGLAEMGALAGGLFFLCLGVHFQSVGWIGNVARLMMANLILLAFFCFDRFRRSGSKRAFLGAFLFWFLALQCNEEAVMLPGLFFIYDLFILRFLSNQDCRRGLWAYLPLGFITGLFLFFQFNYRSAGASLYVSPDLRFPEKALGLFWTLAHLFIPREEILPVFLQNARMKVFCAVLPAAALAGVLTAAKRYLSIEDRRRYGFLFLFSALWFFVAFSPFSLRALEDWKSYPHPRYLYLPLMGVAAGAGVFIEMGIRIARCQERPLRRRFLFALISLWAVFFYGANLAGFCFMAGKLEREAGRSASERPV